MPLVGSLAAAGCKQRRSAATGLMQPLLLTYRVAGHVFAKRRWIRPFFRALPSLLLNLWAILWFFPGSEGLVQTGVQK